MYTNTLHVQLLYSNKSPIVRVPNEIRKRNNIDPIIINSWYVWLDVCKTYLTMFFRAKFKFSTHLIHQIVFTTHRKLMFIYQEFPGHQQNFTFSYHFFCLIHDQHHDTYINRKLHDIFTNPTIPSICQAWHIAHGLFANATLVCQPCVAYRAH